MHGRITYYSSKNGLGAIVNQHKRVYEFNKSNWHDTRTLPSNGMFVVIRLDEADNTITDVKSSRYQNFDETPYLQEADFWKTQDDEELEELEESRKTEMINRRAAKIDIKKIQAIKENKPIERCLVGYFHVQNSQIAKYQELFNSNKQHDRLDYALMRRFIDKALNQLFFVDKGIKTGEFDEFKQRLVELDYILSQMNKGEEHNLDEIFERYYLKYQIEYLAIRRKIEGDQEEFFKLKTKSKHLRSEINLLNNRSTSGIGDSAKTKEKLTGKSSAQEEVQKRMGATDKRIQALQHMMEQFIASKRQDFKAQFAQTRQEIIGKLKTIQDHIASNMDTKIWEMASKSKSIKQTFYKENIDAPFCSITFLRFFLKRLKIELLKEEDRLLYEYLKQYDSRHTKRFLLVTENSTTAKALRTYIFSINKNYLVTSVNRPVEFYTVAQEVDADVVLVDQSIQSIGAHELVIKGRQIYKSSRKKFIMFGTD